MPSCIRCGNRVHFVELSREDSSAALSVHLPTKLICLFLFVGSARLAVQAPRVGYLPAKKVSILLRVELDSICTGITKGMKYHEVPPYFSM